MNKFFMLILGCALCVAGCSDQIETAGSSPAIQDKIIYTKSDNSLLGVNQSHGIFVIDTNGQNATTLGTGEIAGSGGGKIVYFGLDNSNQPIKIITSNNDGTNPITVFTSSAPSQLNLGMNPVISPDGLHVSYIIQDIMIHASHLFVVGTDGNGTIEVAKNLFLGTLPTFSPDGKSIAYFTRNAATFAPNTLETVQIDGSNVHDVCAISKGISDQGIANISWSTKGKIAFTDGGIVYTVPADGSQAPTELDMGQHPVWAPDGNTLCYSSGVGTLDIITTSDLGLTKQNITNSSALNEDYPCWSSDGKHIICISWTGAFSTVGTSLKIVTISTTSSSIITTPSLFAFFLK
jgi:Tol biopolymer transport system component